jgi:hypothetical protein
MSFDLHISPCRFDGTMERRKNPFTNQVEDFPRNLPLTRTEIDAVLRVFKMAGCIERDDVYIFQSADGASVEIFSKDLTRGCMFAVRGAGVTPLLCQFLFDVLAAGNWVVTGEVVIAPNENSVKDAPVDFGKIVIVSSGKEIATILSPRFDAYSKLRDRVLGGSVAEANRAALPRPAFIVIAVVAAVVLILMMIRRRRLH